MASVNSMLYTYKIILHKCEMKVKTCEVVLVRCLIREKRQFHSSLFLLLGVKKSFQLY